MHFLGVTINISKGYILFLFILFIVQRFVHSRKTKSFQHSVKMNPRKSFLLASRFSFPLVFCFRSRFFHPPLLTKFIFLLVHHRSTIDQSTKESNGNETETKQIKARGGVVCCMWVGEMVRINVLALAFFLFLSFASIFSHGRI